MARVLTLHVGLEKTGTTLLQHRLAEARRLLRQQGIDYPGRAHGHHGPVRDLLDLRTSLCDDSLQVGAASGTWGQLRSELAANRDDAIVSCEYLSWATADDADRTVRDLPAEHVRVVITTRPLRRSLPSLHHEQVRHGETRCAHAWLDESVRPEVVGVASSPQRLFRADPVSVIERWRAAGVDELVVVPMGDGGRDFLTRFLLACGVDPSRTATDGDADVARPVEARNVSEDRLRLELLRRVIDSTPASRDCAFLAAVLRPAIRFVTRSLPVDDRPMDLCGEHERWARSRDAVLAAQAVRRIETAGGHRRPPDDQHDAADVGDGSDGGAWCRGDPSGGPLAPERLDRLVARYATVARIAAAGWATARRVPGVDATARRALARRYHITGAAPTPAGRSPR